MEMYNPNLIPIFLEASKKEELIKIMWSNNYLNSKAYNYMPPVKEGKKWVVWFYADVNNWKMPSKKDIIENVEVK
jgi:hypothetical protein